MSAKREELSIISDASALYMHTNTPKSGLNILYLHHPNSFSVPVHLSTSTVILSAHVHDWDVMFPPTEFSLWQPM